MILLSYLELILTCENPVEPSSTRPIVDPDFLICNSMSIKTDKRGERNKDNCAVWKNSWTFCRHKPQPISL